MQTPLARHLPTRQPTERQRRFAIARILILFPGAIALPAAASGAPDLAQAIRAQTGLAVAIDPRIDVPTCSDGFRVDWADDRRASLLARCSAPAWQLVIPVVMQTARAEPMVRRGDTVRIRKAGAGFEVQAMLQAVSAARVGDVLMLRNAASGKTITGRVGPDGEILLPQR